jgi:hypothetical protein
MKDEFNKDTESLKKEPKSNSGNEKLSKSNKKKKLSGKSLQ